MTSHELIGVNKIYLLFYEENKISYDFSMNIILPMTSLDLPRPPVHTLADAYTNPKISYESLIFYKILLGFPKIVLWFSIGFAMTT